MPTLKEIKKNLPEDTPERRAEVLRSLQESLARNREALYRHAEKERTAILEELAGLKVTLKQSGIESVEDPKEVFQALLLLADHPVASVQKAAKSTLKAFHTATNKDDRGLSKLGDEVPYRTSLEIRALVHALVEGPQGKNWNESEGEIALIHNAPEELLQTKFTGPQCSSRGSSNSRTTTSGSSSDASDRTPPSASKSAFIWQSKTTA